MSGILLKKNILECTELSSCSLTAPTIAKPVDAIAARYNAALSHPSLDINMRNNSRKYHSKKTYHYVQRL